LWNFFSHEYMMTSPFKNNVLSGRVALVTGGGSGIGFEIARQIGLHGAKGVVIMGRRQQFLDEAVQALNAFKAAEGQQ
jgi:peroxisomal 2,4-dienoyl-CoA reductase